ncbi:uncharacterized protein A4U43_C02F16350 [Asparagus officinalis]|uniref:Uncharacterized protein n=1 Tax=Asparagus officinalis TaxID=4686 RepID=A0A5P1FNQ8_ASPOF|nr:uncharacterized protein A4U43_C02F16350 [Asparagus officinalis]
MKVGSSQNSVNPESNEVSLQSQFKKAPKSSLSCIIGLSSAYQLLYLLDATGFNTPGLHVLGVYVCRATGQELVIESLLSFACLSANSCLPVLRAGVVVMLYLFKWSYGLFRSQVQELLPSVFITFMSWSISEKSGELAVYIGLNADNEIIHTLSFLARVMIWSQVWMLIILRESSRAPH